MSTLLLSVKMKQFYKSFFLRYDLLFQLSIQYAFRGLDVQLITQDLQFHIKINQSVI